MTDYHRSFRVPQQKILCRPAKAGISHIINLSELEQEIDWL